MDIMKELIKELEKGKNSVHIVRSLILQHNPRIKVEDSYEIKNDDNQDYYKDFHHHSMVALDSYLNTISMLKSCDYGGVSVEKRKFDHLGRHCDVSPNNSCISGVSANQEAYNMSNVDFDDRRGCYKKRKISREPREEEVTHLIYDGFGWRKYGQKKILSYQHPRHYYRCTHKYDQNCQAIKQVQQVSDNPTKYKLIYHGNHTCNDNDNNNNVFKTSPYTIDSPEEHSSTMVLNFDGSSEVNTSLFPTSSYSDNLSTIENTMIPRTNNASVPVPLNHVYDESWSTTASPISLEEEYFTNIIADFSHLPDLWTV
ncbi:uncharacterized protein LOC141654908 [Silene latifolia]|uniref:uncharacterized protein LOC141654908 n=1 Tax=Silene latifolia TaxID=37657 RepID=UPI003D78845E